MKKSIFLLIFSILLTGLSQAQVVQRKKTTTKKKEDSKAYFDESGGFKHRLWYGGGFNLSFGGNAVYNSFLFGLSPMVGYKITDNLSIGPRLAFDYQYIKGQVNTGAIRSANLTNFSFGPFLRYKFFNVIFIHVEGVYESTQNVFIDGSGYLVENTSTQKLLTERNNRLNFLPGLGYNSGGLFAMDLSVLYNYQKAQDKTSLSVPFDFRLGFTYKF